MIKGQFFQISRNAFDELLASTTLLQSDMLSSFLKHGMDRNQAELGIAVSLQAHHPPFRPEQFSEERESANDTGLPTVSLQPTQLPQACVPLSSTSIPTPPSTLPCTRRSLLRPHLPSCLSSSNIQKPCSFHTSKPALRKASAFFLQSLSSASALFLREVSFNYPLGSFAPLLPWISVGQGGREICVGLMS